jgi:hypothetical protein
MAAEGMTMNTMDQSGTSPGPRAASSPFKARKTLIFANDKSSGKTTTANAVLVSLLQRYPMLMRGIDVREYERQPRLSLIFKKEDGFQSVLHRDARNGAAFDMARELAYDPNATPWDDLLYDIGIGNLIVDLGSNTFSEICRILDDEPRPIFPDGGDRVGVVVPVTTAADSLESGMAAIDHVSSWGPRTHIFIVEQEYLGRFTDDQTDWNSYRDRMLAADPSRVTVIRIEKLLVADIGSVVFQRIDKIVENAQAMLRSDKLTGAALLRALRQARAEISWGNRTLDSMKPIADWFAN